jgi:protein TonB
MTVGISPDIGSGWLRKPITLGLLVSAGLHFIFFVLFQVSPASSGHQVVLINARLQAAAAPAQESPPALEDTEAQSDPAALASLLLPEKDSEKVFEKAPEKIPEAAPVVPVAVPVPPREARSVENAPASSAQASEPTAIAAGARDAQAAVSQEARRGTPEASGLPSLPLGIDTNWYLARQVDKHPKAIGKVEPIYPEEAKRRNIEGTLKLMLKIDDLGRVLSAEVVEATPPGVFDAAALQAFREARFQPAIKDGRPVRYQAYIRVDFKLED